MSDGGSVYAQKGSSGGSIYATKSGSGGSVYATTNTTTTTAAPAVKKKRSGVGGFVQNLGGDLVNAVEGFGPGLVQTGKAVGLDVADIVKHPESSNHFSHITETVLKPAAKQYAQTYGPLTHGDVSAFLHNLYSHPLGPILDLATLATGGAGVAAKTGVLSDEAALLELTAPNGVEKVVKQTSHNPAIRARQQLVHHLQNKLPYEAPHVGEAARYGRAVRRLPKVQQLQLLRSKELHAYNKAVRPLNPSQTVALHLIGNDFHPADYSAALHKLADEGQAVEPAMFKVLDDPKVHAEFENPSPKVLKAVDAAEALSELDKQIRVAHGQLSEESAASRVAKHRPAVQDILGGELRPTPNRPFFVPDVPTVKRVANSGGKAMGGGASTPRNINFENRGVLFRTGQLVLNADLLGPHFLESVKYGLADDLHATLMKGAARISKEEARAGRMPKGWEFIPKDVVTKTGRRNAQKIEPLVRGKAAGLQQMETALPAEQRLADSFTVRDLKDAATLHGDYLIVPTELKKQVVGEFTRSTGAIRKFLGPYMTVWRALVLGLRVGFLTNNLVGNHLLYAIKAAGPTGLRAYLNAVKRVHGESAVKQMLTMKGLPEPLRQQFMREFFPDQIEGTFGATNRTGRSARLDSTKVGRAIQTLATGVAPATQAVAEGVVRRALVETLIRKSPEYRLVARQMKGQTRDFETIAEKVLNGDGGPAYQAHISEQVNNTLGDYLNLTKFEQEVLRQVFPFYSWYKAIARITAHLVADTPGRTDALAKLGQIGQEQASDNLGGSLPEYLKGLAPIGANKVLSTRGLNPIVTDIQLGQGAIGVLTGDPGDTGKAFSQLGPNPLLLAAIQDLSGKDLFSGRDLKGGRVKGLPGQILSQTFGQVPQITLGKALAGNGNVSKTYGKQTAEQALLQYLGVPLKPRPAGR